MSLQDYIDACFLQAINALEYNASYARDLGDVTEAERIARMAQTLRACIAVPNPSLAVQVTLAEEEQQENARRREREEEEKRRKKRQEEEERRRRDNDLMNPTNPMSPINPFGGFGGGGGGFGGGSFGGGGASGNW